jgi:hypothetical protein
MATALGSVIDALISSLSAVPALAGVTVEGTAVVSGKRYTHAVVIGDDGDPESENDPSFAQEWANMAHTKRSETGDIPCAALATTGSTASDVVKVTAFQIMAEVESFLRADTTIGGVVFTSEITEGAARVGTNSAGTFVVIPFSVHYWTHV